MQKAGLPARQRRAGGLPPVPGRQAAGMASMGSSLPGVPSHSPPQLPLLSSGPVLSWGLPMPPTKGPIVVLHSFWSMRWPVAWGSPSAGGSVQMMFSRA